MLANPVGAAKAIVGCTQQNAACKLESSLGAVELALETRAGAGGNGLPVLIMSNTTLVLGLPPTGASTLDSKSADSFAISPIGGQGETLGELNSPCSWITAADQ